MIVVATLMRPRGETGVQTHFNAFLRYLSETGTAARCVTPFDAPRVLLYPLFGLRRLIDPLSGTLSVWWYRHWHFAMLRRVLRRVLAAQPDSIVYAQCPLSARAALEARSRAGTRVVMVAHFNISQADEWADKGKIAREGQLFHAIRRFEADVLPRVDGLVYVSEFMRKAIEQRIPAVARVPSVVVPNFLAPAAGQPNSEAKADLVSIGTLEPRKNQEYLLRILAAAARRGRRFTLALIGDGPDRARLERLANELGVADQVHFLGFVPHAAQCLPHYRAYCHAARMESFGLAILEAMSYGRPVLAAPVGGVPEVFADGSEGRYWPLDDADAAAGILIEMFSDADQLARMGGAARETFLTRFQTNVLGARLLAFLQFEPNAVSP